MKVLITGAAGFIGAKATETFLAAGHSIIGVDNLNAYYDPSLKQARLSRLQNNSAFQFSHASIEDKNVIRSLFETHQFDTVLHLAAQAGVRHSIENPRSYVSSNLIGTFELLEAARHNPPQHMLLASTSSVYGANAEMPYQETQRGGSSNVILCRDKESQKGWRILIRIFITYRSQCFAFSQYMARGGAPIWHL